MVFTHLLLPSPYGPITGGALDPLLWYVHHCPWLWIQPCGMFEQQDVKQRYGICHIQPEVLRRLWRFFQLCWFCPLSRECMSWIRGAPSAWVVEWKATRSRATAHSKKYMFVAVSHHDLGLFFFSYWSKVINIVDNAKIHLWARLFSPRSKILACRLPSHIFFLLSSSA